jgi:hypothetical protein
MNDDITRLSFTLCTMITQSRFTHGSETRKQPNREKIDFQTLLQYEQQEAKLIDELHTKLGLAVATKVRCWPERFIKHPALDIDIDPLQLVSYFKCHCTYPAYHVTLETQNSIGNSLFPYINSHC